MKSVNEECRPILLQVIISKLSGKAYAAIQHGEITSWEATKRLLETTFCAKRTPGYLQLELSAIRHKTGETVQEYSARIEKTLYELCNVRANNRSTSDTKAIGTCLYKKGHLDFIYRGLTVFYPKYYQIKSYIYISLEEAIKASFEEDKMYQSHKDTQKILHNKSDNNSINKYCKNCKRNNHSTN